MNEQKAFNYLKELSKTHPKAFRLYAIYRNIDDDTGEASYLFEFDVKLPFTKLPVGLVFDMSMWNDKALVKTLTNKIDNIILGSDYDELKDMLARNKSSVTINWSLYKAGFEFYLKNLELTKVSTFFDKLESHLDLGELEGEHHVMAEINSLITSPVYRFTNFDDFVTEVNCLTSKAKNYCNKNIVSHLTKNDTFTFTSSFMYKPAHSIIRITKTQGDIIEFSAKYSEFLMPYVELVDTQADTFYNL